MVNVVKYILSVAFLFILTTGAAQKPKPAAAKPATTVQKFTPPKLICSLGNNTDSAVVFLQEALQLVNLPLRITDDKKNIYTITSYQAMYKRRAVTEDEVTGKVSPVMSNVIDRFNETPLPKLWKNILTEQMKAGEELYFFDIVAKDAQGRLMFAPNLSIKIK